MGKFIFLLCTWGCALLFIVIGLYARTRKDPMWFWSGSTVSPYSIKDIHAYNQANCIMWCTYSVPYWISGLISLWKLIIAVVLLLASCTIGIIILIRAYEKIEQKYRL